MKKKIIFVIIIIMTCTVHNISKAEENTSIESDEIIKNQASSLNIGEFLKEADKYSSEVLEDIDFSSVLQDAISGNIDTSSIGKKILNLFFKELIVSLKSFGSIIIILLIHSFLKNISDGLENTSVSKVTYYVTYILIVSIIMVNFSDVINMVKGSINDLCDFINCLFPILLTLLASTGGIISSAGMQPILLAVITIIGNLITQVIIPLSLVSIALNIVSNISEKAQITKLSKFINSTSVWILGIALTVIVTLLGLEGNLASGVDKLTVKTTKAAVSGVIPVVGKILR